MKSYTSTFVVFFILAAVLVFFIHVRVVKAEGTIYIRADGAVEGTDKIQRYQGVYTFLGNISIDISGIDGIIIQKSNIVIDGAGYILEHLEEPTGRVSEDGIVTQGQNNITITNIDVHNFLYGIAIKDSSNITITKTSITNNHGGIHFVDSSNNSIIDNQITSNNNGIDLIRSENNTIDGNTLTENSPYGLNFVYSSENVVSNNNISKNGLGIYINFGGANQIFGNTIAENNGWGMQLSSSNSSINNNIIYHNNFINNQVSDGLQVSNTWFFGPESNIWDNGEEGNYWSDYTTRYPNATEIDDSGIWNTPFIINENNIDHYPIKNPTPLIPEFPSFSLLIVGLLAVTILSIVYRRKFRGRSK